MKSARVQPTEKGGSARLCRSRVRQAVAHVPGGGREDWRSYAVAAACTAGGSGSFWLLRAHLGKGHAALLYLPVVVMAASLGGLRAGIAAAFLSFACWDFFFLNPLYTFVISDPKDWISLLVFLVVGLVMGVQTGRLRDREAEAQEREQESTLLYRISASVTTEADPQATLLTLAQQTALATGAPGCLLANADPDGSVRVRAAWGDVAGCWEEPETQALARWSLANAKAVGLPPPPPAGPLSHPWPVTVSHRQAIPSAHARADLLLPLPGGDRVEGVLYLAPPPAPRRFGRREGLVAVTAAHLATVILERERLQMAASHTEALREADRLRSTFVSSVSHNLKTPLASVNAVITSLLQDDVEWDGAMIREALAGAAQDLAQLDASIGELLAASQIEAGAWRPRLERYELAEAVGVAVARVSDAHRRRVEVALPASLPSVELDIAQWPQMLLSLLDNALRYSAPDSPVRVGARAEPGAVVLWVADRGPGVQVSERERIFEKFYRGSASEHGPSGTGLGLAIAREIARAHGGRLWVVPTPAAARAFVSASCDPPSRRPCAVHRLRAIRRRLRPLAGRTACRRPAGQSLAMTPERPLRVLVADDEAAIRRALRSVLAARKYEVLLASSGQEALALAAEATPDLVILDLSLGDSDGLEICREMRAWLSVPILVLTVRGGEADKVAALDAGADDYLTKPFSTGELLARMRALLRRSRQAPASEPVIAIGDVRVDVARRAVTVAGAAVRLTRTEFDILAYLATNAGRVVTYRNLLENVRGVAYESDIQTLRVHVGHLRRKLEPNPGLPRYILTEPGVGYRCVEAAPESDQPA